MSGSKEKIHVVLVHGACRAYATDASWFEF
jgi:hypothetical protein